MNAFVCRWSQRGVRESCCRLLSMSPVHCCEHAALRSSSYVLVRDVKNALFYYIYYYIVLYVYTIHIAFFTSLVLVLARDDEGEVGGSKHSEIVRDEV
jgi:hypothetical protein